jgi:hypothetical protein
MGIIVYLKDFQVSLRIYIEYHEINSGILRFFI